MANPPWMDALAGLFENPLFQFGANLAALSGKHRFGEAFGGAVAATGKNVTAAKRQKKLEELQAEEVGIRKETLGLTRQELEAKLEKEKRQVQAGSQLEAAIAGIPGIDPVTRARFIYMARMGLSPSVGGGYQDQMLGMSRERLGLAQDAAARAQAEVERRAGERAGGEKLIEDQLADVDADPTLSPQEKTDKKFAIRAKRSPPKRLSATEKLTQQAMEDMKNPPAAGAPEAPAPEGPGILDTMGGAVKNWWQGPSWIPGGAPATPLAPPGVPMTGTVSPAPGPLAPPAQDPAAILGGLEASLKTLNPQARQAAKMQLQTMLANPALAGLHERIRGLVGQL